MGLYGPFEVPEGLLRVPKALKHKRKIVCIDAGCPTKMNRTNHLHQMSKVDYSLFQSFKDAVTFLLLPLCCCNHPIPLPGCKASAVTSADPEWVPKASVVENH